MYLFLSDLQEAVGFRPLSALQTTAEIIKENINIVTSYLSTTLIGEQGESWFISHNIMCSESISSHLVHPSHINMFWFFQRSFRKFPLTRWKLLRMRYWNLPTRRICSWATCQVCLVVIKVGVLAITVNHKILCYSEIWSLLTYMILGEPVSPPAVNVVTEKGLDFLSH